MLCISSTSSLQISFTTKVRSYDISSSPSHVLSSFLSGGLRARDTCWWERECQTRWDEIRGEKRRWIILIQNREKYIHIYILNIFVFLSCILHWWYHFCISWNHLCSFCLTCRAYEQCKCPSYRLNDDAVCHLVHANVTQRHANSEETSSH